MKTCIEFETSRVTVLCGAAKTPVARMAKGQEFVRVAEFLTPFGKDGFLAVNSLLAFAVILSRVFVPTVRRHFREPFLPCWEPDNLQEFLSTTTEGNIEGVLERETIIVLYGPARAPAGDDEFPRFPDLAVHRPQ